MTYPYQLPPLPYAYDALSGFLEEETLRFHHDKHFKTYVDNLNTALADCPELQAKPLDELLSCPDALPEPKRVAIVNNGGGVYNHDLYFNGIAPNGGGQPDGALGKALEDAFGSCAGFVEQMKAAAVGQFGSGYAFLCADTAGALSILKLPNQDTPLGKGLNPLLCLDVWEHAYYLDYQNRRADYVTAWFDHINWPFAQARFL